MAEPKRELPLPGLEPGPITLDEYMDFTPEKLELWSGYLIDPPDWPEQRRNLLALLLVNCGLVEAVGLAPRTLWMEALDRAHPSDG